MQSKFRSIFLVDTELKTYKNLFLSASQLKHVLNYIKSV